MKKATQSTAGTALGMTFSDTPLNAGMRSPSIILIPALTTATPTANSRPDMMAKMTGDMPLEMVDT